MKRRVLSLLLALALVLSMVPSVFASDWEAKPEDWDVYEPELETIELTHIADYTAVTMTADGEAAYQLVWTATEAGTLSAIYPTSAYYGTAGDEAAITYTVTLNGEEIDLTAMEASYEIAVGDEIVIVPVVAAVEGAPEVSFEVYGIFTGAPGSVNNPIVIESYWGSYTTETISASDIVYFTVNNGNGYTLTIENAANIAVRSGFQYVGADENGVITMTLSAVPATSPVSLMIMANDTAEDASYIMTFTAPPVGSQANPEYLASYQMGDKEAPMSADLNYTYAYEFSPSEDGKLIITYDESTAAEGSDISITVEGPGISKVLDDAVYDEAGNLVLTVDVTADNPYAEDPYTPSVYNIIVMDWNNVSTSVPFNVAFVPTRYTVTWEASEQYTIWASKTADIVPGNDVTVFVSIANGYKTGDAFAVKANDVALEAVSAGVYSVTVNADTKITVEGIEAEAPAVEEEPKVAIIVGGDGTEYSLNDAIALAAQTGTPEAPVTVQLTKDADLTGETVTVVPGVTLDIASYNLTAGNLFVINGGNLFSSNRYSGSTGHGTISVGKDNLVITSTTAPMASATMSAVPIWLGDCYALINTRIQEPSTDKYALDTENHTVAYEFRHGGPAAINTLFGDNGASDHGIKICIRATWDTTNASTELNFWYTDSMIAQVANSSSAWYTFSMGGMDNLGVVYESFALQAIIITDAGVCVFGPSK